MHDAVVVHPGAAFPARRWPADRFAVVVQWARAQGFPVAVTGSQSEVPLAESAAGRNGGATVLAGRTSLLELAGLVSRARLVICGDTGVAHLATAYGVPSVVLFGPVSPAAWGPPCDGPHVALWHGSAGGDPWADQPDPGLLDITAAEVIEAAQRLVN
jgi:ADP-heptose:LPS heptosyltransferase